MLGLLYLLVVVPLREFYLDREAALEDRQMLVPRLEAASREVPALRARLAELRSAASTSKITLDGASDAIAAANLESRIEEIASSLGTTLGSTEGLPAENRGGYRRIGVRIAVSGEYEALVKLVGALETASPPLVVDNLHIRNVFRPTGMPGAGTGKLDAAFEVYGFRSTDAPAGTPH